MEPVVTLGLSVRPNRTELVVLRGRDGRGAVLDRVITATHDSGSASGSRLRQTVEAVLQTRALAVAHGYHVHAVGVMSDGANDPLTHRLIVALESAGLNNVTALDPMVADEIFTRSATAGETTDHPRSQLRRHWIFVASLAIALAALAFAIGDQLTVHHRSRPTPPAPTPTFSNTAVETPPPPVPASTPPSSPTQETPAPDPPTPAYRPPARPAPVQQQPAQPPPPPTRSPPAEPLEPAPPDNCMFLCGVTI
jgi:hypothetical protein